MGVGNINFILNERFKRESGLNSVFGLCVFGNNFFY